MSKLAAYKGIGKEALGGKKFAKLKIAQALSPERNKNKSEYIKGLEEGQFFTTDGKIYGESIDFVVLSYCKNYLITEPTAEGKFVGYAWQWDSSWLATKGMGVTDRKGNKITTQHNFVIVPYSALLENTESALANPYLWVLKKSDAFAASDFLKKIADLKLEGGEDCPLFGGVWRATTVYKESAQGSWFSVANGNKANITSQGFIPDEVVDAVAEVAQKQIEATKAMVDAGIKGQLNIGGNAPAQIEQKDDEDLPF